MIFYSRITRFEAEIWLLDQDAILDQCEKVKIEENS